MQSVRHIRLLALAAFLALATLALGLQLVLQQDRASAQDEPLFNPWVNDAGEFYLPPFDDREFTPDERMRHPVLDPRWEPFAACMEAQGHSIVRGDDGRVYYQGLIELVAQVNAENPVAADNNVNGDLTYLAIDFTECANEHLGRELTADEQANVEQQMLEQSQAILDERNGAGGEEPATPDPEETEGAADTGGSGGAMPTPVAPDTGTGLRR